MSLGLTAVPDKFCVLHVSTDRNGGKKMNHKVFNTIKLLAASNFHGILKGIGKS